MRSPIRRAGAYTLLAAIVAVGFAAAILGGPFRAVERSDYMTYQTAAIIVRNGDGDCLYTVECQAAAQLALIGEEPSFTAGALPFNSPPWLAGLLVPLAGLSLATAFAIFTFLSLLLLGWGAYRLAWGGPATRLLVAALVLSAWPTVMAAIRGQSSLAVAGLLALSVAAGTTQLGSGAAAGLSAIKPTLFPLWLAWLAVAGRWRALLVAALTIAALVLLANLVASPGAVLDYPGYLFGSVADSNAAGVHVEQMMNWRGAASRLGIDGIATTAVGTLVTLGILGAAWWWARSSPRAPAIGAASALAATPLVITHANQHEAILVALSVVIAVGAFEELRPTLVRAAIGAHSFLWLGAILPAELGGWALFVVALGWLVVLAVLARREAARYPRQVAVQTGT
jgi:hypothetical protein